MPTAYLKMRATMRVFVLPPLLLSMVLTPAIVAGAQARAAAPARPAAPIPAATEKDLAATQEQLIKLLRESPTLTTVVEHDPSLLSNQEYVRKNNPQLAQFLEAHPEIPLNPDYYLFTNLDNEDGHRDRALEHAVWPDLSHDSRPRPVFEVMINDGGPFVVLVFLSGVVLWLVRVFLENRRWNRIFKLQMEVHGRLIDKFGTSQELLTYMDTEAGKRFLEAAPLPVNFEGDQRMPSGVARILTPLQIGVVLSLLGIGFFLLRHTHRDMELPMLFLGTVFLMPGLGFIISAGITWMLAGRLGLMPDSGAATTRMSAHLDQKFDPRDRQ
jgi:hypothetical protein